MHNVDTLKRLSKRESTTRCMIVTHGDQKSVPSVLDLSCSVAIALPVIGVYPSTIKITQHISVLDSHQLIWPVKIL